MSDANKQLIKDVVEGKLNILDCITDDAQWVMHGLAVFNGRREIIEKFMAPFAGLVSERGKNILDNLVAEGDQVVAQFHVEGRKASSGKDYNNTYCIVYDIDAGRIHKITEYCDTALVRDVFGEFSV